MSLGAVVLCINSPQAASTITLVVEERHKPAAIAIAIAFLGWSLALAFGVPLMSVLAASFGWRQAYFALALLGALMAVVLALGVPRCLATVALPSQN